MNRAHSRATIVIVVGAALGGLAGIAVAADVAFACVVQPLISIAPRSSGAAGSKVTVAGANFMGTVELRWNALNGPEVASAQGPNFLAPVVVPRQRPGLYTLIALGRGPDGSVEDTARAEFLITGSAGSPAAGLGAAVGASGAAPRGRTFATRTVSGSSDTGLAIAAGVSGLVFLLVGGVAGMSLQRRSSRPPRLA